MQFVVVWIVSVVIGGMIGSSKGKTGLGIGLSVLLGPLGVIIMLFVGADREKVEENQIANESMRKCPFCAELVKSEAIVCKHCGKDLPAPEPSPAPADGWRCPKCGNVNQTGTLKCSNCFGDKPA